VAHGGAVSTLAGYPSVEVVFMLGVNDLAKHFAVSPRAIHRRLTVCGALDLEGVELAAKGYRVSDQGLAVLGRMLELERDGSTIEEAASTVKDELGTRADDRQDSAAERRASVEAPGAELVSVLKHQVDDLRGERDRLMGLLEQAQAMLPTSSASRQRLGRWAALRAVVTGRV